MIKSSAKIGKDCIEIINTDFAGLEINLNPQKTTIGKSIKNNICLDDPLISDKQAVIFRKNRIFYLEVINFENKVFVNNNVVDKKYLLANGDIIKIGKFELLFKSIFS
ncbi:MAG: FHA domain-containing protein [Patescibacteria group bacterium]|nr:FHA domain-containing protein [Patescibacteria group bacterium]